MLESKEKVIDGKNVTVTPYPARKGNKIKDKLITLFGPSLLKILSSLDKESKEKTATNFFASVKDNTKAIGAIDTTNIDLVALAAGIETLIKQLSSIDQEILIFELIEGSFVDGQDIHKPQTFDIVFAANYLFMYKVLIFILEVNFKSFLSKEAIGTLLRKA